MLLLPESSEELIAELAAAMFQYNAGLPAVLLAVRDNARPFVALLAVENEMLHPDAAIEPEELSRQRAIADTDSQPQVSSAEEHHTQPAQDLDRHPAESVALAANNTDSGDYSSAS